MCLKPGMLAQGLLHGEDEEECDGGQYWIQGAELQPFSGSNASWEVRSFSVLF